MAGRSVSRVLFRSFGALSEKSASFRPSSVCHLRPMSTDQSDFGLDGKHWLIQVKQPEGNVTRDELINMYVQMLASVVGSEEEARMKMYSVSTRFYYAFGALMSEELSSKFKEYPNVVHVLRDCYIDTANEDYGGEPFIDGKPVPYDPKYPRPFYTLQKHWQGIDIDLDETTDDIPAFDEDVYTDAAVAAEILHTDVAVSAEIQHTDAAVTAEIPHPDAAVTAEIPHPDVADKWYSPRAWSSKARPPSLALVPKLSRFLATAPLGTDLPKASNDFKEPKENNALSGILGRLQNVTRPTGKLMFPYVRPSLDFEVLEQKLTTLDKDFVYELVIDVWPIPDSWIIHGIWPGYIKGDWIVYYVPKHMDADSYRILKEAAKKEILELDDAVREILHTVWRSYTESHMCTRDQNIDFWAHEKIKHCWDWVICPRDGFFKTLAGVGQAVRKLLIAWSSKVGCLPNTFYQTKHIRQEMAILFKVRVYLYAKRNDDKKIASSNKFPYWTGLTIAMKPDANTKFGVRFVDHPSASTKIARGWVYFLQ